MKEKIVSAVILVATVVGVYLVRIPYENQQTIFGIDGMPYQVSERCKTSPDRWRIGCTCGKDCLCEHCPRDCGLCERRPTRTDQEPINQQRDSNTE